MKRGQLSVFLLVAVVILIGGGIVLFQYNSSRAAAERNAATNSLAGQQNLQGLEAKLKLDMESCSMGSIIEANKRIGFRDSVKADYESFVSTHTKWCMQGVIELFKEQNFNVRDSSILTRAEFYEESITVNVTYPIVFTRSETIFQLEPFETVLKKTSSLELSAAASEAVSIESSDRRVELKLEEGTTATDPAGNPVNQIGIKLVDRQFDSLNNPLVLGNVVYEGLPDGATFSKPVELSIEFDTTDRYLNVDESSLSIAWWDSSRKLWIALPTTIKDGIATAMTDHFTKFAVLTGCAGPSRYYGTPILFIQKYNSSEDLQWRLNKAENQGIDGQTIIPLRFSDMKIEDQPFMNPPLRDEETLYGGEQFKDKCDNENPVSNPSMLNYCCCKGNSCLLATGVQDCQQQQSASYEELDLYKSDSPKLTSAIKCAKDRAAAEANFIPTPQNPTISYPCDLDDQDRAIVSACSAISPDEQTKKLGIGYTRPECIGGVVRDSNGDNSIFFIALKADGGTCIKEPAETQLEVTSAGKVFHTATGEEVFSVKTVSTDPSVTCTATVSFEGANTPNNYYNFSRISVKELKVEKDITLSEKPADANRLAQVDTSASCLVQFDYGNAGWIVSGEKRTCATAGTYGIDTAYSPDGSAVNSCAACAFDSSLGTNVFDFSNPLPITSQNCLCTLDSVGWQYCPGTIPITINGESVDRWECKLENGVPTPVPWQDSTNICGSCTTTGDTLSNPNCKDVTFTNELGSIVQ